MPFHIENSSAMHLHRDNNRHTPIKLNFIETANLLVCCRGRRKSTKHLVCRALVCVAHDVNRDPYAHHDTCWHTHQ